MPWRARCSKASRRSSSGQRHRARRTLMSDPHRLSEPHSARVGRRQEWPQAEPRARPRPRCARRATWIGKIGPYGLAHALLVVACAVGAQRERRPTPNALLASVVSLRLCASVNGRSRRCCNFPLSAPTRREMARPLTGPFPTSPTFLPTAGALPSAHALRGLPSTLPATLAAYGRPQLAMRRPHPYCTKQRGRAPARPGLSSTRRPHASLARLCATDGSGARRCAGAAHATLAPGCGRGQRRRRHARRLPPSAGRDRG